MKGKLSSPGAAHRCDLCRELRKPNAGYWNEPLFKTENFVVIPSLGSLVEGWMLIVPRDHYISAGALPDSLHDELRSILLEVHDCLLDLYGAACIFEHGPSASNRKVGCGVDHAHVHVVPFSANLTEAVSHLLPGDVVWSDAPSTISTCKSAHDAGQDYLYIEQPFGEAKIATGTDFGSQLIRRAIAKEVCLTDEYNWRDFPQLENVRSTIARVKLKFANGASIEPVAV